MLAMGRLCLSLMFVGSAMGLFSAALFTGLSGPGATIPDGLSPWCSMRSAELPRTGLAIAAVYLTLRGGAGDLCRRVRS